MTSPGGTSTQLGMHSAITNQIGLPTQPADFGLALGVPPLAIAYINSPTNCESSSESRSPEASTAKASDREIRIKAEKQRRSQYNTQISLMTSLLSDIMHSQRKVDKTSVLRLAANKLRNEHVFGDTIQCCHLDTWSPAFLKFFDLLGGVMLGITCRGRIFIISPNVQEKLGYCHVDLLGQNFYNYVHPEDKDILRHHIYPPELQKSCNPKLFDQRHDFHLRIMRASARSDPPRYEQCRIDGNLRKSDKATANSVQDEQVIKRQRVRTNKTFSSSGNDFVFIGMIHILSSAMPPQILPPTTYSEYWTRHLIDGRIVQCDYNISLAIGYMTDEVIGTSAFVFMHKEDVRWVICVLRQMYDESIEFGESFYRLMSRSGQFIYMRTRGFLEIDKKTKHVQSFVCVNSVIPEDYGCRMMNEMKRKYSVIVDVDKNQTEVVDNDEPLVEHPKRLERIVMHLVEPSVSETIDELKLVPPSKENIISAIQNSERVVQDTGITFDSRKRRKIDCDDKSDENLKRQSGISDDL